MESYICWIWRIKELVDKTRQALFGVQFKDVCGKLEIVNYKTLYKIISQIIGLGSLLKQVY